MSKFEFIRMTFEDTEDPLFNDDPLLEQDEIPTAYLCLRNMVVHLAGEIIDMRNDPDFKEAKANRYAEIEKALGPRMVEEVRAAVREWWPPYCLICSSEERLGPEGANDTLEVYQAGGGSVYWTHKSCTEKIHSWSEDNSGRVGGVTGAMLDAAWQKKHPGVLASTFYKGIETPPRTLAVFPEDRSQ